MKSLTNGQIEVLISLVEQNIIDREQYAQKMEMALDPNWLAYQKKLIASLKKEINE